MPDLYGPFDTATFAQAQWYRDRGYLEPSGVIGPPSATAAGGDLGLTAAGFGLSLGLGRARVRGAAYERTGTAWTDTVPANTNPTQARIDRLVLRRDLVAKTVTPVRLQGTPAASPAVPALTRVEDGVWELPLFRFTVPAASGTPLVISDERPWLNEDGGGLLMPSAELYMTSTSAVLAATTWHTLNLFGETLDTHGGHVSGSAAGYTVPLGHGGNWLVDGMVNYIGLGNPAIMVTRIQINGNPGPNIGRGGGSAAAAGGGGQMVVGARLHTLAEGDVVTLGAYGGTIWQANTDLTATQMMTSQLMLTRVS